MNNQNESPFSSPRFILSIIVVFVFLWGWQYYVNKKYPPQVVRPATTAPVAAGGTAQAGEAGAGKAVENGQIVASADTTAEKSFQYEDENVKWEISSKGMSFSHYQLKKYLDKEGKTLVFGANSPTLQASINNKEVNFDRPTKGL